MTRSVSALIISTVLLVSLVSTPVSAAASLSLSSNPMASEATTDQAAIYTILIENTGDEDLTVSLSASQAADCNGFTSTLDDTVISVSYTHLRAHET